jgi:glycogen debranching enzyme
MPTPFWRLGLALMGATWLMTPPLPAQQRPTTARFSILTSPIGLSGDARPHQYLGVIGRRAAWLGEETGGAELWVHPFKLADHFELAFRIPDYVDPIRGADVARTVEIRPELTTITYTHATFTVREHILAPLDEPGLLLLLDVQAIRPLEVIVNFQMVFQYAWPGAFGGQYTYWDDDLKAFVLSESRRQNNGVIGSSWASVASSHPAHALPDAPNTFVIPVDTARAGHEFVPIAIAAGTMPRDTLFALYRRLITGAERYYRERRAYDSTLLAETATLETPDPRLNLALQWSKVDLDEQQVCNPDLGCGLVAGWGPSGKSTRPGFGWFFGGDAAINSFAMDGTGQWAPVAQGLRFLARYQRADGKIPHEISQAAGRIPWFTDFPYAYYHADTTPFWLVAVWRYWKASGDRQLVRDLWPAIQKAYAWCLTTETDGDGIIENTTGGLGAIEVGELGEDIHQDVYLAGVWIQSLRAITELARLMAQDSLAGSAARLREKALTTLNEKYWREAEGYYAFGILRSGRTNDNLTMWPATAQSFGLLRPERAERMMARLASDVISTDWGARPLSSQSRLYDPMHYNNGAVWPFVTGFVSWGQYNARRPWSGYPLIDALSQMTFDWARGRHPELLSGAFYRPLDTAVPHQFFATSMLLSPVLSGLLGWDPDAARAQARLAPQLPPSWQRVTARRLRVGPSDLTATIERAAGRATVTLAATAPLALEFVQSLPAGARNARARLDGKPVSAGPQRGVHDDTLEVRVEVGSRPRTLEFTWTGGLEVDLPRTALTPGQPSSGLRVLDFRPIDAGWTLVVEGTSARRYDLRLVGEPVSRVDGAEVAGRDGQVTTLAVTFPPGTARQARTITLSR